MEQTTIKAMVVNELSSQQDMTGEWSARINLDFLLSESNTFSVFGRTYTIDRINLSSGWHEELELAFATESGTLSGLSVPDTFIHMVIDTVIQEQAAGKPLHGWSLEDAVTDLLAGDPVSVD